DVIEEILRIYRYNNIEIPAQVRASLQHTESPDPGRIRNLTADMLAARGFNEIWSNSLTKSSYYNDLEHLNNEHTVKILNPLSNDLNGMRQTLLFGGLEAIEYNINRQNRDLKLFEFGNCYFFNGSSEGNDPVDNYSEEEHLALFITGFMQPESWLGKQHETSFFQIKTISENILKRAGLSIDKINVTETGNELFSEGISYIYNNKIILETGIISDNLQNKFEIDKPVYYADFNWSQILSQLKNHKVTLESLPKFPAVRRDLALLIDKEVKFGQIRNLAFNIERNILREVNLFDVYDGKGIPEGKKSYAVSFILRDYKRTLKDKQIDKTMEKFVNAFEREFGARLR
ncbi:MAG: phenylalanine--tRNA ligase subunit beta, partial [Prolixibacteraceae bacterium]|nr:phenylalanine--tRNA ligase subunit beta [Prolixibacteraceae bacterium]